jgi:hypothetical protein
VYYHYCGGELESVSALFKSDGCCGDEEEEEDNDCCKNETKVITQLSESFLKFNDYKINLPLSEYCYSNFIQSSFKNHNFHLADLNPAIDFKVPLSGRNILNTISVLII